MDMLSRWMECPGRCGRRKAWAVFRFGITLFMALNLVHTLVHLAAEPHHSEATCCPTPAGSGGVAFLGDEDFDCDHSHDRHSAGQHSLKMTLPARAPVAELALNTGVMVVRIPEDSLGLALPALSGLAPPELPRAWQFAFRAALPVRAPSLPS